MTGALNSYTPAQLLRAYASGFFPMAETAESQDLHWLSPDPRAVLPLDERFHVPRSLQKFLRKPRFILTHNHDFPSVLAGCAARPETWINEQIIDLYTQLYSQGYAQSIEAWDGAKLVGGLYGIALGHAFFAESMFSNCSNASKVCLVELVHQLRTQGFTLCDVQFRTPHLAQFGVMEIPRAEYLDQLSLALGVP